MFNLNELKHQEALKKRKDAMARIRGVLEKEVFAVRLEQLACLSHLSIKTIRLTVKYMPDVIVDDKMYWLKPISTAVETISDVDIAQQHRLNTSEKVFEVLRKNLDGISTKDIIKLLDINMYQLNNSLKYLRKRYQIVRENDKLILKDCVAQVWPIYVEEDRTSISKAILTKHDIERLLCKAVGLNQVEWTATGVILT